MKTSKEKASYCIGLEAGRNLMEQFGDIDVNLLQEGFKDALSRSKPKLENEEIHNVLVALKNQVEEQQRKFIAQLAKDNKDQGEAFLASNKTKEGVVTLSSGLQYRVLSSGSGASPTLLDVVTTHYKGSFIDGTVFDSTYENNTPATFPVNRTISGWSEALQKMKVGDKWQLFIPSYLAYGEMGFGREIGPNAALIFEMELLGINNNG